MSAVFQNKNIHPSVYNGFEKASHPNLLNIIQVELLEDI